jgi:hypothetical protein
MAAVALALAAAPAAQAAPTVVQGESLTRSPASAGGLTANGTQLVLWSTGSASRVVTTTARTTSLVVRARGAQCEGAPRMTVDVDGYRRIDVAVTATALTSYTAAVDFGAAQHNVKVSFTNDLKTASCDRNLYVDHITLQDGAATTPAPTPPASGTPVPAGGLPSGYRLTWQDEFNGSAVNAADWKLYSGPGTNGVGTRLNSNVTVGGGELRIAGKGSTIGGLASRRCGRRTRSGLRTSRSTSPRCPTATAASAARRSTRGRTTPWSGATPPPT